MRGSFLELMGKPDVDSIEGLSPAISIEQKTTSRNPRSTVGTVTEIHDYMRLLWARAGVPYSPATGEPIEAQTVSQMVDRVMAMKEGTRRCCCSPRWCATAKANTARSWPSCSAAASPASRWTASCSRLARRRRSTARSSTRSRRWWTAWSCARAPSSAWPTVSRRRSGLSDGVVYAENADDGVRTVFSSRFACPVSGFTIEEIEPRLFSFNSPHGACPECDGLGVETFFDPHLVVPDERLALAGGAIAPWSGSQTPYYDQTLQSIARHYKASTRTPWEELPERVRDVVLHGSGEQPIEFSYKDGVRAYAVTKPFEGVIRNLERRFAETDSAWVREEMSRYQAEKPCKRCLGARLKPEALAVKVAGLHIAAASDLPIRRALAWFGTVHETLTPQRQEIARRILREISERLQFLVDVGLDYLTLSRGSTTLSGGESQRIRLASQIGSGLTGVLYVLDEPSIGPAPAR